MTSETSTAATPERRTTPTTTAATPAVEAGRTMTKVRDLETLDRPALAALWAQLIGGAVPGRMSQELQRRFLAHELQVRICGDLPKALAVRIDRAAQGDNRKPAAGLMPGARLLRQWNGTTHVVEVEAGGFRWNGARHASLSAIARAITGARWSGPRFFGLRDADASASRDPGSGAAKDSATPRPRRKVKPPEPGGGGPA